MFESVPSFAYALDRVAPTATWGPLTVDIAYGGAFYALVDAQRLGVELGAANVTRLIDLGRRIKVATCLRPMVTPLFCRISRSIRLPAKGCSRCSSSIWRISAWSASDSGWGT